MANDFRLHVFIWSCGNGTFAGMTIGQDENVSAAGDSPKSVVRQIREWADEVCENHPWQMNLNLANPRITHVPVRIRPEIRVRGKMQPYAEQLSLRIPAVLVEEGPSLLLISFPTLDMEFSLTSEEEVTSMVSHLLASQLSGKSMAEILTLIPPDNFSLDSIAMKKQSRSKNRGISIPGIESGQALKSVCEPLIAKRRGGGLETAAFERDEEVQNLASILEKEGSSLILVGESGVGKSTILKQAVRKMPRPFSASDTSRESDDPFDKDAGLNGSTNARDQFWVTNGSRLIAGMKYLGEWEQRCETLINDLNQISGVLCLESLLEVIRIGGQSPDSGVAAFFQPYIQRGDLRLICEATPHELEQARRLLPGFVSLFQVFKISELDSSRAIPLMSRFCDALSSSHHIQVENGVPRLVYHLFRRFQSYSAFPGPAVRFVRGLSQKRDIREKKLLNRSVIHEEFSSLTGLPPALIRDEIPMQLENVQEYLQSRIVGQNSAVNTISEVVIKLKAGLNDPKRPVGVYLFCGPTGVGKTALASALAEFLFGHNQSRPDQNSSPSSRDYLIRLDMSEYSHPGAASRLIQSVDGSPSHFIKSIRQNPFSVLLLDEIEKADEEVFDLLLNVLDEGTLSDPIGRVAYFRSSIIILTSNIGATAGARSGFGASPFPDFESEVLKFFRPEFFNRLDAVIPFSPLDAEATRQIASIELDKLMKRPGLENRNIRLKFNPQVVDFVARSGFDPKFGARPLLRKIEESISVPLSKWLLDQLHIENCTIAVSLTSDHSVNFSTEP